eukprot:6212672-Pleurochrysis_carterae.AAC.5
MQCSESRLKRASDAEAVIFVVKERKDEILKLQARVREYGASQTSLQRAACEAVPVARQAVMPAIRGGKRDTSSERRMAHRERSTFQAH